LSTTSPETGYQAAGRSCLEEAKPLTQEQQQFSEKERFRQLLVESFNFLNQDEVITYKYVPTRDALREKISNLLYKP
jgi:hypothetical protein